MRTAPSSSLRLLSLSIAAATVFVGCKGEPETTADQPSVVMPDRAQDGGKTASKGGSKNASKSAEAAASRDDRVLAEVSGVKIMESQVLPALYESYGLDVLLKVVQLDMARAATEKAGITVSASDVDAERNLTLQLAFPDQKPEDYDNLLTQLLSQQRVSRAEFAIVMETNANLRALVKGPAASEITEEAIRNEFNMIYGERVRIRHIALNNLQEVAEAQRRLAGTPAENGHPAIPSEPFEKVAAEMSANRMTAAQGGELPPFARTSGGYSQVFIEAAFALKPGEVSTDAIQEGKFYHLIKVIERLPPQAVKFESVRDSVRDELIRKRQNGMMAMRRGEMAQLAIRNLTINEPTLKKQFADRLAAANPTPADRDEVRRSLDEQRERLNTTNPATLPATTEPALHSGPSHSSTQPAATTVP